MDQLHRFSPVELAFGFARLGDRAVNLRRFLFERDPRLFRLCFVGAVGQRLAHVGEAFVTILANGISRFAGSADIRFQNAHQIIRLCQIEDRFERSAGFGDGGEEAFRLVNLSNVGVGQPFDLFHLAHDVGERGEVAVGNKGTAFLHPVHRRAHPRAKHAVTAPQMMVEERQRRTYGEAVQPERDLGELHGHRVEIDPVDAALEYHAAHDMAVIQLVFDDRPVMLPRVGDDPLSQLGNELHERRSIIALGHAFGIADCGQDLVRKPIDQADEEMPASHCGVDDAERKQCHGRIVCAKVITLCAAC